MKTFLFFCTIMILMPCGAHADWQYTKWGMTPPQVIAASHKKAHATADIKSASTNDESGLLTAPYTVGKFKFSVTFLFNKQTRRLSRVNLELLDSHLGDELHGELFSKYGAPISKSTAAVMSLTNWRDESHNNNIALIQIGADHFYLQYSPIRDSTSSGF